MATHGSRPAPPSRPLPKGAQPVKLPSASDLAIQRSESGIAIPIVFGTVKVSGNILERFAPVNSSAGTVAWDGFSNAAPLWQPSTAYARGTVVVVYRSASWTQAGNDPTSVNVAPLLCVQAGISGSGYAPVGAASVRTPSPITDGTCQWLWMLPGYLHYLVIGICEGPIVGVGQIWQDTLHYAAPSNVASVEIHDGVNWRVNVLAGSQPQSRPAWSAGLWNSVIGAGSLVSGSDTYGSTACLFLHQLSASSAAAPGMSFEVKGLYSSGVDANPADIAIDLLTHSRRGLGLPSSRIDSVSTGAGAASWRTYCQAAGLQLSWAITSQQKALDLLAQLLEATNTECVWSGGVLKFVPLGGSSITANGTTFTPNTTPVYDLGPDDFLEPLEVTRVSSTDTYNSVPVQYVDRASGYSTVVVDDPEMSDVDRRGLKRDSPIAHPFVLAPASAIMLSRIAAQRSLQVRNTWTVRLGWRYMLIEPTDLLTLTDPVFGLNRWPVRVVAWEEDAEQGTITLTCEDWPSGVASAAAYTPQARDGYQPNVPTPINGLVLQPGAVTGDMMGAGQVGTGHMSSGPGVNLLYNSDFSAGVPSASVNPRGGISWAAGGGAAVTGAGLYADPSWTLAGDLDPKNANHDNTFYVYESGHAGGAGYVDCRFTTLLPVDPSKRYAWSIHTGANRCNLVCWIEWIKSDGTSYSSIRSLSPTTAAGGNINNQEAVGGALLSGWKRIFSTDAPPSDAAYARVLVRKADTVAGQADSYMFVCRAQFEEIGIGATFPGPWVPSAYSTTNPAGASVTKLSVALQGNWYDDGGAHPLACWVDHSGNVRLSGLIHRAVSAAPYAFVMPVGMRPAIMRTFVLPDGGGTTTCNVNPDGTVYFSGNLGTVFTLDPIAYVAEQ